MFLILYFNVLVCEEKKRERSDIIKKASEQYFLSYLEKVDRIINAPDIFYSQKQGGRDRQIN